MLRRFTAERERPILLCNIMYRCKMVLDWVPRQKCWYRRFRSESLLRAGEDDAFGGIPAKAPAAAAAADPGWGCAPAKAGGDWEG